MSLRRHRISRCDAGGSYFRVKPERSDMDVLINQWRNRFYTSLQNKDWDTFKREMLVFCTIAAASVALGVYQLYLNQWLQIRWRKWMTSNYLRDWVHDGRAIASRLWQGSAGPSDRFRHIASDRSRQTRCVGARLRSGSCISGKYRGTVEGRVNGARRNCRATAALMARHGHRGKHRLRLSAG